MRRLGIIIIGIGLLLGTLAPSTARAVSSYVALGDSVAAGAGLPSFDTPTTEDELCDRSPYAYPYYVAAALGSSVTNFACSGAKIDEGIYDEQTRRGTDITPQLDRAFENGTPELITMTIGANDARWTQFIRDCYVWRCGSTFDNGRAKVYRTDIRIELYLTLQQISQRSSGAPPQVLLSGYYAPFPPEDCTEISQVTSTEQAWLSSQTTALNQAIQSVLPYFSFARYVPVNFAGHELCSADPWIQNRNDEAPFHPTITGQSAIAQSFLTQIGY